jgi:hypothetical protein
MLNESHIHVCYYMIMCTDILWIHKIHDIIKTNISWSNIKNVAYWQIIKKSKSPMMSSCLPQSVRIIDLFSITCTFTVGELSYVTYMMLAFADRCQGPFRAVGKGIPNFKWQKQQLCDQSPKNNYCVFITLSAITFWCVMVTHMSEASWNLFHFFQIRNPFILKKITNL